MRWLRWFTRNWATTDDPDDPSLASLVLPLALAPALVHVEETIRRLPRWQIEEVHSETLTIHASRQTRFLRFVDDIIIRLEPTPDGTRIHVRSQSRFGVGDLGQNRRNIRELLEALGGTPRAPGPG